MKFSPDVEARIAHARKTIEDLPLDARVHVVDQIFTGCLRVLEGKDHLAQGIGAAIGATGVLIVLVKESRYCVDVARVEDASGADTKILQLAEGAVRRVLSPETPDDSPSIH